MKVRHIESGEIYKIRLGQPVGGELASDIATFVVRGGYLVLLGKPGTERPTTTSSAAAWGRKIEQYSRPPDEGTAVIY